MLPVGVTVGCPNVMAPGACPIGLDAGPKTTSFPLPTPPTPRPGSRSRRPGAQQFLGAGENHAHATGCNRRVSNMKLMTGFGRLPPPSRHRCRLRSRRGGGVEGHAPHRGRAASRASTPASSSPSPGRRRPPPRGRGRHPSSGRRWWPSRSTPGRADLGRVEELARIIGAERHALEIAGEGGAGWQGGNRLGDRWVLLPPRYDDHEAGPSTGRRFIAETSIHNLDDVPDDGVPLGPDLLHQVVANWQQVGPRQQPAEA